MSEKISNDGRLKEGTILRIHTYVEGSLEEEKTILFSKIVEIFGREIAIEAPVEKDTGRARDLLAGDDIFVTFIGDDRFAYSFPSRILRTMSEKNATLFIEKPTERVIARVQRDSYLWVPVELDLEIIRYNPVKMESLKTMDLSGGGLTFQSEKALPLNTGQVIAGVLYLVQDRERVKDIHFSAVVVRKVESNKKRRFAQYSIQFLNINERDRDQIIQFCLRRQLELHKK